MKERSQYFEPHAAVKANPQVSIGMPVFNGAKFIRSALDSLLVQTFIDFELIISDNASTDGTEVICREYATKDKRIRYVRQPKNMGAVANFKYVLHEAAGEYFMWAAADDVWAPNFVQKCRGGLVANEGAGMAIMAYICVSRFSRLLDLKFKEPLSCIAIRDVAARVKSYSILPFASHKDNLVYSVWRKSALEEVLYGLALAGNPNLIGASMNEYALSCFHGVYISEVGFYKSYRYVPPGHQLSYIFEFMALIKNKIYKKDTIKKASYGLEDHLKDLCMVLKISGFNDIYIKEIVDINRACCSSKVYKKPKN